jgi:hypothetical protein
MFTTREIIVSIIFGAMVTIGVMFCYGGLIAKKATHKILFWSIACLLWIVALIEISVVHQWYGYHWPI